jgi:hypothetical protein
MSYLIAFWFTSAFENFSLWMLAAADVLSFRCFPLIFSELSCLAFIAYACL